MKKNRLIALLMIVALAFAGLVYGAACAEEPPETDEDFPLRALELLEPGVTSYAAGLMQARLLQLGYFEGPLDSTLTEETIEALRAFQAQNGMDPDGAATPDMQRALLGEGAVSAAGEALPAFDPVADLPDGCFIGNLNTHKFHCLDCPSVGEMKDKNKRILTSRDLAEDGGFVPCQRCNP